MVDNTSESQTFKTRSPANQDQARSSEYGIPDLTVQLLVTGTIRQVDVNRVRE